MTTIASSLNPLLKIQDLGSTGRLVMLRHQLMSSQYQRHQYYIELTGSTANLAFNCYGDGTRWPFLQSSYVLYANGVPVSVAIVDQQSGLGTFVVDLTQMQDKTWQELTIGPMVIPEINPVFFVFLNRSGLPLDPSEYPSECPVESGTYYWTHPPVLKSFAYQHQYAWVPARYSPLEVPLVPRDCPDITTAVSNGDLYRTNLVPTTEPNWHIHRTVRAPSGVVSTANYMSYHFANLVKQYPYYPLLDGPRGVGAISMPTHIQIDRVGGAHVLDPWRLVRVAPDGTIETRCGWRSKRDPNTGAGMGFSSGGGLDGQPFEHDLELVGDWSAIPPERHGMHETWGFAWDERTLAIDSGAAQIGPPANRSGFEHPHVGPGPVGFIADSQNNRVLKLQFSAVNHDPPVVTEFITGLADPWDCVYHDGSLYISERKANRIVEYDATTGALIRVVLQGPAYGTYAYVNDNRFVVRTTDPTTIRSQTMVLPEGLVYQDGFLYFGSMAMGQVKKIELATDAISVACEPFTDNNSRYMKISISDGTFGPRGTIFASTWSIGRHGYPEAFLPGGARWNYTGTATSSSPEVGPGGSGWAGLSYSAAQGIGKGRMICGSAAEGLVMISARLGTDPAMDITRYRNGFDLYEQHFRHTHGPFGYGYQGLSLPWGVDADIDYFLEWHGHRRNKINFKANLLIT